MAAVYIIAEVIYMTTDELLCVKTIAERGSISKAAETLHISRVTLSGIISAIEEELGVRLFYRTSRGMVLSAEGTEYILFANRVLKEYDVLKNNLSSIGCLEAGLVSFASSGMMHRFFLRKFLQNLSAQYPNIKVKILDPNSPTIERNLSLCEIDMAVLHTPVDTPGLSCKCITKEALMMIVPKGHPIEKKTYFDEKNGRFYIDIKDIGSEKIALTLSSHRERKIIDNIMYENHIVPNVIAEFRRYETLLPYIFAENAVTFTMHSFCISTYDPQSFNYYWVKNQEESFELSIIRSEKLQMTKAAQIVQREVMQLIPTLLVDISQSNAWDICSSSLP